jgi:dTDP-4-amino-4,6-dideoxygalactose transaminase
MIPFNKPHITGKEFYYINEAILNGHISGNGIFTEKVQKYFEIKWGFKKCLLTTSCTDALEMAALLLDIKRGDEVIMPSYTFVSTALAFDRQGAIIKFVDSRSDHPGMDEEQIKQLITHKTKVIVPVHYAGIACDMDKIMALAQENNLFVVEDAAQAINGFYKGRPLGSIGNLGCFSFHETKNIQCGEGGMLVINDERFLKRADILWEKGTNRAEFFRGEVDKYNWVDTGSSFLPSDIIAAFLWAQLEEFDNIQIRRKEIWDWYNNNVDRLLEGYRFQKPYIPDYSTNNGHIYYIVLSNINERTKLINDLRNREIYSVFHYQSLHKSPYYVNKNVGISLPNCDRYSDCLIRLPIFLDIDLSAWK